ncbi:hypothetical protein Tco_0033889 [Tanacetum coccineum]
MADNLMDLWTREVGLGWKLRTEWGFMNLELSCVFINGYILIALLETFLRSSSLSSSYSFNKSHVRPGGSLIVKANQVDRQTCLLVLLSRTVLQFVCESWVSIADDALWYAPESDYVLKEGPGGFINFTLSRHGNKYGIFAESVNNHHNGSVTF